MDTVAGICGLVFVLGLTVVSVFFFYRLTRENQVDRMIKTETIRKNTLELHTGTHPRWELVRRLISEMGIDPLSTILALEFPDDIDFDFGIIVTLENRVFQYGITYINNDVKKGRFSEWVDLTKKYQYTPYAKDIEVAFDYIKIRDTT